MRSERGRLTALYGGLLVLAGMLLTGVVYLLVREGLYSSISLAVTTVVPAKVLEAVPDPGGTAVPSPRTSFRPASPAPFPSGMPAEAVRPGYAVTQQLSDAVEGAALDRLLMVSLGVLALYALASVVLAWWMAGRVLRPVAVITDTARRLSGDNLLGAPSGEPWGRIDLKGPSGELKRLADTFDSMLERMQRLVAAQQRFAANAAHELRTPVAVQRAAAEIGLAGDPDPERVARIRTKLIDVADNSERIINGLLLLAASEQGLERREPVRVDEVARLGAEGLAAEAAERGVRVSVDARPLTVAGDAVLLERLLHNLLANAVRHNRPGGRVDVRTGPAGIEVSNTGPVVPEETVPLLFEPFHHTGGGGAGLGLSIVESIGHAHGATVAAAPNPPPSGGLTVRIRFPSTSDADEGSGQ
ncbi:sensor histidine kinase [Streptomyces sp. NPDC004111]|uniref:sensor histidine kinase n=1 Tax=Streptomyces sp. NPDC004111 TaxID=3364690 RepID=UPI0036931C1F